MDAVGVCPKAYPSDSTRRLYKTLRTRDDLPYGLALFDERIGIDSYYEETGTMQALVDTDAIAREWAERVYVSVKADSEPLADDKTDAAR